jgi:hypothetical protein
VSLSLLEKVDPELVEVKNLCELLLSLFCLHIVVGCHIGKEELDDFVEVWADPKLSFWADRHAALRATEARTHVADDALLAESMKAHAHCVGVVHYVKADCAAQSLLKRFDANLFLAFLLSHSSWVSYHGKQVVTVIAPVDDFFPCEAFESQFVENECLVACGHQYGLFMCGWIDGWVSSRVNQCWRQLVVSVLGHC